MATKPGQKAPDDEEDLTRLTEEVARLRRLFHFHLASYAELDKRLERIEYSMVFRFLRFVGATLRIPGQLKWHLSHLGRKSNIQGSGPQAEYTHWTKQAAWASPSLTASRAISEGWAIRPLVSLIVYGRFRTQAALEKILASITEQAYERWELWICTDEAAPEWLSGCVASIEQKGCIAAAIRGHSLEHALELCLKAARGDYIALIPEGVLLDPGAVYGWVESLQRGDADVVYSDWDHVDAAGLRHTPRFTPEFSPELLLQTLYWGRCFLVRTGLLRYVKWRTEPAAVDLEHDLALRLAESDSKIIRVPRILWHLAELETATGNDAIRRTVEIALERRKQPAEILESAERGVARFRRLGSSERASIIICSRTPALLEKCLTSLRPTLDSRHEIVVVAHQPGGPTDLERVAKRHGAIVIPYRGPFHFGAMNGLGVSQSSGSTLVFVNDDVRPLESGWLEAMLGQTARPEIGIVGALLLYRSRTVQHAGVIVGGRQAPGHLGRWQFESPYWPWLRISREVTAVTGACFALRRSVWNELDGFDPRFPVNYNDIDLCLRARRAGYRVLIEAQAVLIHYEAQTRTPIVRHKERQLFFELWSDVIEANDSFFNPNLGIPEERIELVHPWESE